MERFEMAELLSKKAGVSLEEAREALAENEWDLLDAMVALERKHKTAAGPVLVDSRADGEHSEPAAQPRKVKNMGGDEHMGFKAGFRQIWHYIQRAFQITVENDFVIIRRDKQLLRMPVLVLLILLLCSFGFILLVLVLGLFLGCQYRFEGKQVPPAVNKAMEKVEDVADQIKEKLDDNDGGQQS